MRRFRGSGLRMREPGAVRARVDGANRYTAEGGRPPPADRQPYHRTRTYAARDIPEVLATTHATRDGVWGHIVVEAGEVVLRRLASGVDERLDTSRTAWIAPNELHAVRATGDARFYVKFVADSGSLDAR